jgi:hypothetical protein
MSAPTSRGIRTVPVTFDCADPSALSAFWGEVLGYPPEAPPAPFTTWEEALDAWGIPEDHRNDYGAVSDPDKVGPRLFLQKVPEGKTVKNRVHLDVRVGADNVEAEVGRLTGRGATFLHRGRQGPHTWVTLTDPEGNEFCVN